MVHYRRKFMKRALFSVMALGLVTVSLADANVFFGRRTMVRCDQNMTNGYFVVVTTVTPAPIGHSTIAGLYHNGTVAPVNAEEEFDVNATWPSKTVSKYLFK